jgi:uncharacterized protein (DUF433 family)
MPTIPNHPRITVDPDMFAGRACIRGLRMPVASLLRHLAYMTAEQIMCDWPMLEAEDITAALIYAADVLGDNPGALPIESVEDTFPL